MGFFPGWGALIGLIYGCTQRRIIGNIAALISVPFLITTSLLVKWIIELDSLFTIFSFIPFSFFLVLFLALTNDASYDNKCENQDKLIAELLSIASIASVAIATIAIVVGYDKVKLFVEDNKILTLAASYLALSFKAMSIMLKIKIAYQKLYGKSDSNQDATKSKFQRMKEAFQKFGKK